MAHSVAPDGKLFTTAHYWPPGNYPDLNVLNENVLPPRKKCPTTPKKTTTTPSSTSTTSSSKVYDEKDPRSGLVAHNYYRSLHCTSNLAWDNQLQLKAQKLANKMARTDGVLSIEDMAIGSGYGVNVYSCFIFSYKRPVEVIK